jgi:hypothetical protein
MNRLIILVFIVIAGCAARKQTVARPLRPPNHADSGIPCKDYYPLPEGWVCGTGGTVVCIPGWRPYGLDRCVPDSVPQERKAGAAK